LMVMEDPRGLEEVFEALKATVGNGGWSSVDGEERGGTCQHVHARARVRRGEGAQGLGVKVGDWEADLGSPALMVGATEHKEVEGRARAGETGRDVIYVASTER
jgi:hypothetical protein